MISIIFGSNGKGKSSLMTFFLNESAFDYKRIKAGHREIEKMSQELGIELPKPKHLTYLNGKACFRKEGYSKRTNLIFEPARFGIQSEAPEGVKCQFILPYASIGCDEAQTWFSSRDGHVEGYQFSAFEKHRHNNLDLYLTTTRAKMIDLRIRDIAYGFYIKERKVRKNKYEEIVGIDWYVDYIDVGNIEGYLNAGPKDKKHYYSREKITADYDVFELYDPESCKELFYEGFKREDFTINYGEF
ncbi:MAG: hypothetical protein IJW64_04650 [Clostridia bacterium]|nr:hypothetical protein [Clostridia bacterium]